jgi:TonB family protein
MTGLVLMFGLSAPGPVRAQADAGPLPAPAGAPGAADAPSQSPAPPSQPARLEPRSTMRPRGVGFGAVPATAVEWPALTQDLHAKLAAAVADWKDSSGAGRAPKIVVLDFCTWDNQWRPFGAWLADNLSAAWAAGNDGGFAVIDRAKLAAVLQARGLSAKDEFESAAATEVAQALGADMLVNGRYRALDNDLGLTIYVRPAVAAAAVAAGPPHQRPILFVQSRLTMSSDLAEHLGEPLATLGPARAANAPGPTRDANAPGRAGVSYPKCTYCPAAEYSEQGRKKKIEGTVTLVVLVTAQGRASDITVAKSLEPSLDQQAVKTVGTWIFEPAKDASGAPVAVRQTIEVSFHSY